MVVITEEYSVTDHNLRNLAFQSLRDAINAYHVISDESWQALYQCCHMQNVNKDEYLYSLNDVPTSFSFVVKGLFRAFALDQKGQEYNKVFFEEDMFPAVMPALLTNSPANLAIEALENSVVIKIDFHAYRNVLMDKEDLKIFQILYLEKNWVLEKDARELEIVQEGASARYQKFMTAYPILCNRLPQYHIALYLGITPTQLSRIRKKLSHL